MERKTQILKFATKKMLGLEIAPYFNPIAPKREGWNCISLDVFDTDILRKKGQIDPNVKDLINNIEEVDIVGSAVDLEVLLEEKKLLGKLDYIVSSHNFEHLPSPICFLKACGFALKENGFLSMAIPDKRFTFDRSRRLSTTADLLEAHYTKKNNHSKYEIFDFRSNFTKIRDNEILYQEDLRTVFDQTVKKSNQITSYLDIHATVYTQHSFWQIMTELCILREIPLVISEIESRGFEFIVHMKNIGFERLLKMYDTLEKTRNRLVTTAFKN
jgi:SAM-dependent methyltransferase